MTANAFGEDRAACLDAGMNAHIAKPVNPELLYSTLLQWLPAPAPAATAATTEAPAGPTDPLLQRLAAVPGLQWEFALRNVGGLSARLERLLQVFARTYENPEQGFADASTPHVLARWRTMAHSMRGACSAIGANELARDIKAFEQAIANTGTDTDANAAPSPAWADMAQALQGQVARLVQALQGALAPRT